MARSDWAALLAAAVQVAYRHDTRPFLPLAKGLARQTSMYVHAYFVILVEPHIREQLEAAKDSALEEVVRYCNHINFDPS